MSFQQTNARSIRPEAGLMKSTQLLKSVQSDQRRELPSTYSESGMMLKQQASTNQNKQKNEKASQPLKWSSLANSLSIETEGYTRTLTERSQYLKLKLVEFESYISRSDQFVKLFKKISAQQEGSKKSKGCEHDDQKGAG